MQSYSSEKDKQPQSYVTDGSQQAGVYWPHVCYKFISYKIIYIIILIIL